MVNDTPTLLGQQPIFNLHLTAGKRNIIYVLRRLCAQMDEMLDLLTSYQPDLLTNYYITGN